MIYHEKQLQDMKYDYIDWISVNFDYLLVMDEHNYSITIDNCPAEYESKVRFFLDFAKNTALKEVPDPYYGEGNGFERVYDLIVDASDGLMEHLSIESD